MTVPAQQPNGDKAHRPTQDSSRQPARSILLLLAQAEELSAHRVVTDHRDGLSLWVPVHDERHALVTLAAHGIAVSPGSRFNVTSGPHHVRVATSHLAEGYGHIGQVLALTANPE